MTGASRNPFSGVLAPILSLNEKTSPGFTVAPLSFFAASPTFDFLASELLLNAVENFPRRSVFSRKSFSVISGYSASYETLTTLCAPITFFTTSLTSLSKSALRPVTSRTYSNVFSPSGLNVTRAFSGGTYFSFARFSSERRSDGKVFKSASFSE